MASHASGHQLWKSCVLLLEISRKITISCLDIILDVVNCFIEELNLQEQDWEQEY